MMSFSAITAVMCRYGFPLVVLSVLLLVPNEALAQLIDVTSDVVSMRSLPLDDPERDQVWAKYSNVLGQLHPDHVDVVLIDVEEVAIRRQFTLHLLIDLPSLFIDPVGTIVENMGKRALKVVGEQSNPEHQAVCELTVKSLDNTKIGYEVLLNATTPLKLVPTAIDAITMEVIRERALEFYQFCDYPGQGPQYLGEENYYKPMQVMVFFIDSPILEWHEGEGWEETGAWMEGQQYYYRLKQNDEWGEWMFRGGIEIDISAAFVQGIGSRGLKPEPGGYSAARGGIEIFTKNHSFSLLDNDIHGSFDLEIRNVPDEKNAAQLMITIEREEDGVPVDIRVMEVVYDGTPSVSGDNFNVSFAFPRLRLGDGEHTVRLVLINAEDFMKAIELYFESGIQLYQGLRLHPPLGEYKAPVS